MGEGIVEQCAVPGCKNTDDDKFLKFYSVPYTDNALSKEWIIRIGNPVLYIQAMGRPNPWHKICEIHFHHDCKTELDSRLHPKSVPSLYLPVVKNSKPNMTCLFEPSDSTTSCVENSTEMQERTRKELRENITMKVKHCKEICLVCFKRGILYDINESLFDKNIDLGTILKHLVPKYDLHDHTNLLKSICLDCVKQVLTCFITVKDIRAAFNIFSTIFNKSNNLDEDITLQYPNKIDIKSILNNCDLKISLIGSLSYLPDEIKSSVKKNCQANVPNTSLPNPKAITIETKNGFDITKKLLESNKTNIDNTRAKKRCNCQTTKTVNVFKRKRAIVKLKTGTKLFKHLIKMGHTSNELINTAKITLTAKQLAELTCMSKKTMTLMSKKMAKFPPKQITNVIKQNIETTTLFRKQQQITTTTASKLSQTVSSNPKVTDTSKSNQLTDTSNQLTHTSNQLTDMSNKPTLIPKSAPITVHTNTNNVKQYENKRKKFADMKNAEKIEIGDETTVLTDSEFYFMDENDYQYIDMVEHVVDLTYEVSDDELQLDQPVNCLTTKLDAITNTDGAMYDHSKLINGELEDIEIEQNESDIEEIPTKLENDASQDDSKKEKPVNQEQSNGACRYLYICTIQDCTFKSNTLQDYGHHINTYPHKLLKQFNCPHCQHISNGLTKYCEHLKWHRAEEPTQISEITGKRIRRRYTRTAEIYVPVALQCAKCGRIFNKNTAFEKHMAKIHGPMGCPACDKQGTQCVLHDRLASLRRNRFNRDRRCLECDISFDSVSLCTRHLLAKHPKVCLICSKKFARLERIRGHIECHRDMTEEYRCNLCHRKYKLPGSLKNHMRIQALKGRCPVGIRPRPLCTVCGRWIKSYDAHMIKHTKEKIYKCEHCTYETDTKPNLDRHNLIHTGYKHYLCTECGRGFRQKTVLDTHTKLHDVLPQPIKCRYCSEMFNTKYDYKAHLESHGLAAASGDNVGRHWFFPASEHSRIRRKHGVFIECTQCDKKFANYATFRIHVIEKHEKIKGFFKCTICEKGFNSYAIMRRHIVVEHTRSAFLTCKVCSKVFANNAMLCNHMVMHSKERPFKCPSCPAKFKQINHVNYHFAAIHEDRRPFPCEVCNKAFRNKPALAEHTRTHTGERLECEYCDKTFAGTSSKCKHMREVHNIRKVIRS